MFVDEHTDAGRDRRKPISRDQILRREQRGQGNVHFPSSADHEQDWQSYPVDRYLLLLYVKLYNMQHAVAVGKKLIRVCLSIDKQRVFKFSDQ